MLRPVWAVVSYSMATDKSADTGGGGWEKRGIRSCWVEERRGGLLFDRLGQVEFVEFEGLLQEDVLLVGHLGLLEDEFLVLALL